MRKSSVVDRSEMIACPASSNAVFDMRSDF